MSRALATRKLAQAALGSLFDLFSLLRDFFVPFNFLYTPEIMCSQLQTLSSKKIRFGFVPTMFS